jgi:hypothetical protein
MASTQLSPGVVVLERDLTSVANATVDNVAAIVGSFEKGPVEAMTTITSERELLSVFGRPNEYNYEYWFTAAQFLLYGGTLKVVRAMNNSLKNAIDTAQFIVATFSSTDTTLTVAAATDLDVNDLLLVDAELLVVQAVSGNDVTVLRGQLATSAASHAAAAPITLIEPAGTSSTINEGSTFTDADTTLTVTSATTLGGGTNSYIRVDDEIMQITGVSGDNLNVTRGLLGTTASAHTDGSTVSLQLVTAQKTEINETTATGITAPLVKNDDEYETNVENAANNWKWAAKSAGLHGNSLRVVITDAGADQVLSLAQPTSTEWQFTNGAEVAYSAANIYGKVYDYATIVTVVDDSTLIGSFEKDNYITAVSGGVTGRVVAYDPETRFLEVAIDTSSADVLEVGDTISELANNSNAPGSATGDAATVEAIRRELRVSLNPGSPIFQANQNVSDANSASVLVAAVENDYDTRLYGVNQRWANIAPRPTTSAYTEDRGGYNDLMHVLVLDGDGKLTGTPGALLEKHLNVSKASDAKSPQGDNIYYKNVIKQFSQFLYWGSHEVNNIYDRDTNTTGSFGLTGVNREFDLIKSDNSLNNLDDPTGLNPLAVPLVGTKGRATLRYALQGGVDGYTISRPNILGAYSLFNDAETVQLDYILQGPSMNSLNDTIAKAQHIIGIADARKDCIAFISPYRGDIVGQSSTPQIVTRTVEYFDQLGSSSYTVFDNNYKYIYDKYNDVYRYIPCNGDMAGLVLSTTLNQEPWFSPAGFNRGNLRNSIKLAYSPLKDHRDLLYAARVNPIVAFPGQGMVLFGDKTALGYQSAFDRINVRRLFLVIEEAISNAAKTQLFELNDEFTRQQFKNIVEPFLRSVQSRRGIVDFLVVCDGTNNPAEAIDRGEFYAEIFVKPTRSINFITLTFTATRTGASFTELVS